MKRECSTQWRDKLPDSSPILVSICPQNVGGVEYNYRKKKKLTIVIFQVARLSKKRWASYQIGGSFSYLDSRLTEVILVLIPD